MFTENPEPNPNQTMDELLNIRNLSQEEYEYLFLKTTGINFYKTDSDSFLKTLSSARSESKLGNIIDACGDISIYCHSGLIRSRDYGQLLNRLGFKFSDKSTVRGGSLDHLQSKLSVTDKVNINGQPTDTIFVFINPESENDMASLFPVIKHITSQTKPETKPLNMVLIDTVDVSGDAQSITSQQIKEHFPDLDLPAPFIKPW